MYRELEAITDKYTIYKVGNTYEVESKRVIVFIGSEEESRGFIAKHPYGLTKAEREALKIEQ